MTTNRDDTAPLKLMAQTAAELMVPNPPLLRAEATLREALVLFTDHGITAAPVINAAGKAVGVLSRSDLLIHDREKSVPVGEPISSEQENNVRVSDLMTPVVFSVRPSSSASKVVAEMMALRVHHLFVVDDAGAVLGSISSFDILKFLR